MPETASPGPAYVSYRRQMMIEWGHCDPAGIVFNARFFEFFDWSTWQMFSAVLGVPVDQLATSCEVMGFPLIGAGGNFRKTAKFGDTVEIVSMVSEFRRSSFDIRHEVWNQGKLAVEGYENRVWTVRDAENPARLRSRPIPAEVIEKFKAK